MRNRDEASTRQALPEHKVDAEGGPLSLLGVIRRMDIGPVRLEPQRLIAPYAVTQNGEVHRVNLIYRYQENVFRPGDPGSRNLGSLLAAQIALNYGLFCDEMVFHGWFEAHDRHFLLEMAKSTAREIFVNKFLEPNPFLRGPASRMAPVKRRSYLRAEIRFVEPSDKAGTMVLRGKRKPVSWDVHPKRHAVLSSGGKDSLLTFGVLREIGHEAHPIFVNESGRHWFTALNAYRYFVENVPNTARVWTNSDRVFAWMLRHLPFVRQDFAKLRSDEYPIRLWTVAVFLFGALPILRKRGIGRILIGDEFDTTRRSSYRGITHYSGLYDQSRFFDNVLTRYYHRKRWGISQFSILSPLSELLVQKTLVDRYPDLQRHQVSCHAAHIVADRVLPCGRCEKCRRIVGMLKALDADPCRCGYTEEQIVRCLQDLVDDGVHQETEGAEHLAFLLRDKGLIPRSCIGSVKARSRPEIMKLRFDPARSPVDGIPVDLRVPLYRLYLEHAEGAAKRTGRRWADCDPLADSVLEAP